MLQAGCKTVRVGASVHAPTAEDLALINALSARPLTADEVYVRAMILCTGAYDRDHERFSEEVLEQFARSIVGKSLLVGHRHDKAPEGVFYRAEVVKQRGASPALKAWAFMLRTEENEYIRKLMDAGIIRYVSVGFRCEELRCDLCGRNMLSTRCPHVAGQEYEGRIATGTWVGEAEAIEGSLVYLGSQYDAVLTKGAGSPVESGAPEDVAALRRQVSSLAAMVTAQEGEIAGLRVLAADGLRYRIEQREELRALCMLAGEGETWAVLEPRIEEFTADELGRLCEGVRRKAERAVLPGRVGRLGDRSGTIDLSAYVTGTTCS